MKYKLFINNKECLPCGLELLEISHITDNPKHKVVVNGVDYWVEDFNIEDGLPTKISLSSNEIVCKNINQWWYWDKIDYKLKEELK